MELVWKYGRMFYLLFLVFYCIIDTFHSILASSLLKFPLHSTPCPGSNPNPNPSFFLSATLTQNLGQTLLLMTAVAYLSSCRQTVQMPTILDDLHTFYCDNCFVLGGFRTCLEVSNNPLLQLASSCSCRLNFLLVCQAEIINHPRAPKDTTM